jgi:hypothetical protein
MVILPRKLVIFGKLTLKIKTFRKHYQGNQIFLENLPLYGNIYMEIGAHIQNVSAQNVSSTKRLHTKRLRNKTSP